MRAQTAKKTDRVLAMVLTEVLTAALPEVLSKVLPSALSQTLPHALSDDRVEHLASVAKEAGMSPKTLEREIKAGRGPKLTQLSARLVGVRVKHKREWLDSLARHTANPDLPTTPARPLR